MDDQEFRLKADESLTRLYNSLVAASAGLVDATFGVTLIFACGIMETAWGAAVGREVLKIPSESSSESATTSDLNSFGDEGLSLWFIGDAS